MATVASLVVQIGAKSTGLRKELEATQRQLKRAFGPEALKYSGKASKMLGGIAVALAGVGTASVAMAGNMSMSSKAFETLLGDAQAAKDFLNDLYQFASETPFEISGLMETSKRLLAFGFAAGDIIPIMTAIGDAAGMLGSGQEGIDRMTMAISQMQSKGKVQSEEMLQLAEAGVNAWQYLADAMGMSISEVMDKVSAGQVSATEGINAIILGMQKDFKGGMEQQAKEIPGLWSTIMDNTKQVMISAGGGLIEALGIKERLQGLANYMSGFAAYVKQVGIKQALKDLIPPELSLAIFMVAGALTAAAIPAMIKFGASVWTAMAPLLPFIGAGMAIGALAWLVWKNWEPLSDLFSGLWQVIYNGVKWAWNGYKVYIFSVIKAILSGVDKLFGMFGAKSPVEGWLNSINDALQEATGNMEEARIGMSAGLNQTGDAWSDLVDKTKDSVGNIVSDVKELGKTFTGLSTGTNFGGELEDLKIKAKQVSDSIENEWIQATKTEQEQLDIWFQEQKQALEASKEANENYERDLYRLKEIYVKKAAKIAKDKAEKEKAELDEILDKVKQTSSSIENEWVQTTKTELEQLDIWFAEQKAALDETKDHNENYQRDLERLTAVYSARRRKIMLDEQKEIAQIWDEAADRAREYQEAISGAGLKGVDKQLFDIVTDSSKQIESVRRHYRDWANEYSTATEKQKEEFRKAWEANGIQFEITADGMVDFSQQIANEQVQIEEQKHQKIADLHYDRVKYEEQLDEAYKNGQIQRYAELLNTEQALLAQDLAGRQAMMDTYYSIWQDRHRTAMDYMAEATDNLYSGLKGFFTEIINNAKSIGEAWDGLKRKFLIMLGEMVSEWMASRIMMWAMEKLFGGKQQAAAIAQGAATASAWAPAAAMVSLATMGGNMAPAMTALTLTTGLAAGLAALPSLAEGGITTGPTIAEIGEGRYKEAVMPLNKKAFEKVGLVGDKQEREPIIVQPVIQAWDGQSVDRWLDNGGGAKLEKYFKKRVRSFVPVEA